MGRQYARGERAWGICGRSGRKMLLKDMVFDGRYPNMRVDPDWYEARHPLETLPMVDDPVALYRPSPEVVDAPSAPVLTATVVAGKPQLTFTPSQPTITEIASYDIYRGVDGALPTLYLDCPVIRDFLGGITGVTNCTLATPPEHPGDPYTDVPEDSNVVYTDQAGPSGHSYAYYIVANPMGNNQSVAQGPPSAPSNTASVTL